jgi:hypothetical protein
MTEQSTASTAQRLADAIDPLTRDWLDNLTCAAAADELRRLHQQNQSAIELIQSIAYEPHELSLDKAYDQRNWMQKVCRTWLQQNAGERS